MVVLNSTAIEFEWELPPTEHRNGIVRGYKLFVREGGSSTERTTEVQGSEVNEFIVTGLRPGMPYECSMLAFTVADGPRTLVLTVSTHTNGMFVCAVPFSHHSCLGIILAAICRLH